MLREKFFVGILVLSFSQLLSQSQIENLYMHKP